MSLIDFFQQGRLFKLQDRVQTMAAHLAHLSEDNLALQRKVIELEQRIAALELKEPQG